VSKPHEVVRRAAADVEHDLAGLQVELVEAAVAQPVRSHPALKRDVERYVAQQAFDRAQHSGFPSW
jgi:hypothetical protein